MRRATKALWAVALAVASVAGRADGYTGGPIKAEVLGYDRIDQKVFYRLLFFDESGEPRHIFYFALASAELTKAIRAPSVEGTREDNASGRTSPAFRRLLEKLVRLRGLDHVESAVKCDAESVGVDTIWPTPRYRLVGSVGANGTSARVSLDAYCSPVLASKRHSYGAELPPAPAQCDRQRVRRRCVRATDRGGTFRALTVTTAAHRAVLMSFCF